MTHSTLRNQLLALVYFGLSTLLTWWFIVVSPLYISQEQMLLSTVVAGGKWAIQIIVGFLLLREARWTFIRNIGFVCFVGSGILLPYVILRFMEIANGTEFFIGSLIASVLTMIFFYYKAVKEISISIRWWLFWLICLAAAITLQLTIVF